MKKRIYNYFIIILYVLLLVIILKGEHFYGSQIDWINQHTAIPDFFRNYFYETKNLIPNYIFNIGAGQNIFNFSYYGLMSPIILISYILPFIKMENYIAFASILTYIFTGITFYNYLISHKTNNKLSLISTLSFLTLAPITYHFHHHIMFVWYFPFLILSFIGVDNYINKQNSFLLIISIFLLILTNYYFAIPCLLTIIIYGIYKLLEKNTSIKYLLEESLKASLRIIIPILMTSFILLSTAFCMLSLDRNTESLINIKDLIIPKIDEIFYSSFSIGLSLLLLMSSIGNLCKRKKLPQDIFLNISLLILTLFPVIAYFLNGKLYIRGKVLIPILLLYFISLIKFINSIIKKEINITKLNIYSIILFVSLVISNLNSKLLLPLVLDFIIAFVSINIFNKYKKNSIIFIPLIITLLIGAFYNNTFEIYLSNKKDKDNKTIKSIANNINDKTLYRIDNLIDSNKNANRIYSKNFNNTSIYSSTYNSYYHTFYNFNISNNIEHRNILNSSGANNFLFNKIMGVKYIISKNKNIDTYEKILSKNKINIYKNNYANPIIYTTNKFTSTKEFNKLKYPYNIEYLVNYPITNSNKSIEYKSTIQELNLNNKEEYKFSLKKSKKIKYKLPNTIKNKILIITFDMNYSQPCEEGDTLIKINGIKNKLTCKEWLYHNKNKKFKYVLTDKKEISELNIKLIKGKYHINNIKVYTMDYPKDNYNEVKNLKIDKSKSQITSTVDLKDNSYLITSFPYDKGFKAYIDDHEVKSEIVNTAFLGFKVPKGKHKIKIVYKSIGYKLGIILSIIGTISMIILLFYENRKRN